MTNMQKLLRKRTAIIWIVPFIVAGTLFYTDPDNGDATKFWMLKAFTVAIMVMLAHIIDKGIFDYDEADRQALLTRAASTPTGAAIAFVGRVFFFGFVLMAVVSVAKAQDVYTYVPDNCKAIRPLLANAVKKNWADHHDPARINALVEHESCVSLKSSRCCNPKSQLKSAREEGAGLGQITRAYRADGSVRFDSLTGMKTRHPALREWNWNNVYDREDLQADAIVLMNRDNFIYFMRYVPDDWDSTWQFSDAAYNEGSGNVMNDRRMCAMRSGCNPKRWFAHVELTCSLSHAALYGNRSACDISRNHVRDVYKRADKYRRMT